MLEIAKKFKARCAYAMRHLWKDAPWLAVECQEDMSRIMCTIDGQPRERHAAAATGDRKTTQEGNATHFCIASDGEGSAVGDGEDESTSEMENRVLSCEASVRDLVFTICKCPLLENNFKEDIEEVQIEGVIQRLDELKVRFAELMIDGSEPDQPQHDSFDATVAEAKDAGNEFEDRVVPVLGSSEHFAFEAVGVDGPVRAADTQANMAPLSPSGEKPDIEISKNEKPDQKKAEDGTSQVETPEQRFARLDMVGRYQLEKQLDVVIEKCRLGLYSSELERSELKPAAHDRLKWRLRARQTCRDDLVTADHKELAEAYRDWVRNESAIDDVWYCILEKKCKDLARDRVLIGRVQKALSGFNKNNRFAQGRNGGS